MRVLSVDTSVASGSIAILEDGALLGELAQDDPQAQQSTWLLPAIKAFLNGLNLSIKDIDAFAVAVGPGSFTGLRIGISTVKGLAYALKKNVLCVSSLKALALNAPKSSSLVCPVLDARKNEVYATLYEQGTNGLLSLIDECADLPGTIAERINSISSGREVTFLGTGLQVYGEFFLKSVKGSVLAPKSQWQIRASRVASLALLEGKKTDPSGLLPIYLRRPDAVLKTPSSAHIQP